MPKTFMLNTKYFKNEEVYLVYTTYSAYNQEALVLKSGREDSTVGKLSVCLSEFDETPEGQIFFKTWAENEGILEELVKLGILKDTGLKVKSGHVWVSIVKMLPEGLDYCSDIRRK